MTFQRFRGLNAGSGQRPFDPSYGWINMDKNAKWNPEVAADWNDLGMFDDGTFDLVVSHHSLEHVGCGEGVGFVREAYRILRPGGSLLVFVPDMKALAKEWMIGGISDQIYFTNVYGAYMGDEADRHKWGYTRPSLIAELATCAEWNGISAFNWRPVPGADIANAWWIIGMECIK